MSKYLGMCDNCQTDGAKLEEVRGYGWLCRPCRARAALLDATPAAPPSRADVPPEARTRVLSSDYNNSLDYIKLPGYGSWKKGGE